MSNTSNKQLISRLKHLREMLANGYDSPSTSPSSKQTKRSKSTTSTRNKTSTKTTKNATKSKIPSSNRRHGTQSSASKSKYEKELLDFRVELGDKFENFLKSKKGDVTIKVSPDQLETKNKKSSKPKSTTKRSLSTKKSVSSSKRNQKNVDTYYNDTAYTYNINSENANPKATITKITSTIKTIKEKDKSRPQTTITKTIRSQSTTNTHRYDVNDIPPPISKQYSNKLNAVTNTTSTTKTQKASTHFGIENDNNHPNIKNKYTYTNPPPQLSNKTSASMKNINSTYSNKNLNVDTISNESDSNNVNILRNRRYLQSTKLTNNHRNSSSSSSDGLDLKSITKNYKTPAPVINTKKKFFAKDKNSQTVTQKINDDDFAKKKNAKLNPVSKKLDFSDTNKMILKKEVSSDSESFDISKYKTKKTTYPVKSTKTDVKKLTDLSSDDADINDILYRGKNITKSKDLVPENSKITKTTMSSKISNLINSSSSDDFYLNKKAGKTTTTTTTYTTTTKSAINAPTTKGKTLYQLSSSSSDDLAFNKVINKSKNITTKNTNATTTTTTKLKTNISSNSSTDELLNATKKVSSKNTETKAHLNNSSSSGSVDFDLSTKPSVVAKPSSILNKKIYLDSDDDDDDLIYNPKFLKSKQASSNVSPSSPINLSNKINKEFLNSSSSDGVTKQSNKQNILSSNNNKLSPINTDFNLESDETEKKDVSKNESKFKLNSNLTAKMNSSQSSDSDFFLDKMNRKASSKPTRSNVLSDTSDTSDLLPNALKQKSPTKPASINRPSVLSDSSDTSDFPKIKKQSSPTKSSNPARPSILSDSSDTSDLLPNALKKKLPVKQVSANRQSVLSDSSDTSDLLPNALKKKSPVKPVSTNRQSVLSDSSDSSDLIPNAIKKQSPTKFANNIPLVDSDESPGIPDSTKNKIVSASKNTNSKLMIISDDDDFGPNIPSPEKMKQVSKYPSLSSSDDNILNKPPLSNSSSPTDALASIKEERKIKQTKLNNVLDTIDSDSDILPSKFATNIPNASNINSKGKTKFDYLSPSSSSSPIPITGQSKQDSPSSLVSPPKITLDKDQSSTPSPANDKNQSVNLISNSDSFDSLIGKQPIVDKLKPAQSISNSDSDSPNKQKIGSLPEVNSKQTLKMSPPVEVHSPGRNKSNKRNMKELFIKAPDFNSGSESLSDKIKRTVSNSVENNQLSSSDDDSPIKKTEIFSGQFDSLINVSSNISPSKKSQLNSSHLDLDADLNIAHPKMPLDSDELQNSSDSSTNDFLKKTSQALNVNDFKEPPLFDVSLTDTQEDEVEKDDKFKQLPVIDVNLTDTQEEDISSKKILNPLLIGDSSTETQEEVVFSKKFSSSSGKNNLSDSDDGIENLLNKKQAKVSASSINQLLTSEKKNVNNDLLAPNLSSDDDDSGFSFQLPTQKTTTAGKLNIDIDDSIGSDASHEERMKQLAKQMKKETSKFDSEEEKMNLFNSSSSSLQIDQIQKNKIDISPDDNQFSSSGISEPKLQDKNSNKITLDQQLSSSNDDFMNTNKVVNNVKNDHLSLLSDEDSENENIGKRINFDINNDDDDDGNDLLAQINKTIKGNGILDESNSDDDDDNFNLSKPVKGTTVSSAAEKILLDEGSSSLYPPKQAVSDNILSSENDKPKSDIIIEEEEEEVESTEDGLLKQTATQKQKISINKVLNISDSDDDINLINPNKKSDGNFNLSSSNTDVNIKVESSYTLQQNQNIQNGIANSSDEDTNLQTTSKRNGTVSSEAEKILLEEDSSAVFQSKSKSKYNNIITNNDINIESSSSSAINDLKTNIPIKEDSEDEEYNSLMKQISKVTSQSQEINDLDDNSSDDSIDIKKPGKSATLLSGSENIFADESSSSKPKSEDNDDNLFGSSLSNIEKKKQNNIPKSEESQDDDIGSLLKKNPLSNILSSSDNDEDINLINPNKKSTITKESESSSSQTKVTNDLLESSLSNISQNKQNILNILKDNDDDIFEKANKQFNILDDSDSDNEINLINPNQKATVSSESKNISNDVDSMSEPQSKDKIDNVLSLSSSNTEQKKQSILSGSEEEDDDIDSFIKKRLNRNNVNEEINLVSQNKSTTVSSEAEKILFDESSSSAFPPKPKVQDNLTNNMKQAKTILSMNEEEEDDDEIIKAAFKLSSQLMNEEEEEENDILNEIKKIQSNTKVEVNAKNGSEDENDSFALYKKNSNFSKNPMNDILNDANSDEDDDKDDLLLKIDSFTKSTTQSQQEVSSQKPSLKDFSDEDEDEVDDILNPKVQKTSNQTAKTTMTSITKTTITKTNIISDDDDEILDTQKPISKEQNTVDDIKASLDVKKSVKNEKDDDDSDYSNSEIKYLMKDSNKFEIFKFDDDQSSDEDQQSSQQSNSLFPKSNINKQSKFSVEEEYDENQNEEEENFQFENGPRGSNEIKAPAKSSNIEDEDEEENLRFESQNKSSDISNNIQIQLNDDEEEEDSDIDIQKLIKSTTTQKVETQIAHTIIDEDSENKIDKKENLSQKMQSTLSRKDNPYDDFSSDDGLADTNSGPIIDFNKSMSEDETNNESDNTEIAKLINSNQEEEEESAIPISTKQFNNNNSEDDDLDILQIKKRKELSSSKQNATTIINQTEISSSVSTKNTNSTIQGIDSDDSDIIGNMANLDDIKTSSSDEDDEELIAIKQNYKKLKSENVIKEEEEEKIEKQPAIKPNENAANVVVDDLEIFEEEEEEVDLSEIDRILHDKADANNLSMKKNSTINLSNENDDDEEEEEENAFDTIKSYKPQASSGLDFTSSTETKSHNSVSVKSDSLNKIIKIDAEESENEAEEDLLKSSTMIDDTVEEEEDSKLQKVQKSEIEKILNMKLSDEDEEESFLNDIHENKRISNLNIGNSDDDDDDFQKDPELLSLKEEIQKQNQKQGQQSSNNLGEMNKEEEEEILQIISKNSKIEKIVNAPGNTSIDIEILISDENEEEENKEIKKIIKESEKIDITPHSDDDELMESIRKTGINSDDENEMLKDEVQQIHIGNDEEDEIENDIDLNDIKLRLDIEEDEEDEDDNVF